MVIKDYINYWKLGFFGHRLGVLISLYAGIFLEFYFLINIVIIYNWLSILFNKSFVDLLNNNRLLGKIVKIEQSAGNYINIGSSETTRENE